MIDLSRTARSGQEEAVIREENVTLTASTWTRPARPVMLTCHRHRGSK